MFFLEPGKRLLSVHGKAFQNHLQPLSTARSDLVERADFFFLTRIFVQIVEVALAVQDVVPVSHHPKLAKLGIDPTTFFKRVHTAAQAWGE